MSLQSDKQFKDLRHEIAEQLGSTQEAIAELQNLSKDPRYRDRSVVIEFQLIIDGLAHLKTRADELTRTLDHG